MFQWKSIGIFDFSLVKNRNIFKCCTCEIVAREGKCNKKVSVYADFQACCSYEIAPSAAKSSKRFVIGSPVTAIDAALNGEP